MIGPTPKCVSCAHLQILDDKWTCSAFPQKIPEEILVGGYDHSKPFKGDHNIQYQKGDPFSKIKSEVSSGIIEYVVYSRQGTKLGVLSEEGKLDSSNQKLLSVVSTLLDRGVFTPLVVSTDQKVQVDFTDRDIALSIVQYLRSEGFKVFRQEVK